MTSPTPPFERRPRARSWREKAEIRLVRQRLDDMAQEASKPPEAMPARGKSPFLAYHGECDLWRCPLVLADMQASAARGVTVFNARMAIWSAARQR